MKARIYPTLLGRCRNRIRAAHLSPEPSKPICTGSDASWPCPEAYTGGGPAKRVSTSSLRGWR